MATIFLFLGLRISWPEKRVGRSEKKKKNYIGPIMSSCRKKLPYMEIVAKSGVFKGTTSFLCTLS